ncbi:hypothetical protein H072_11246 [Dactylellina haptotyla CBS 200.50]|uniref:F-box domain-containing protein n=1 Tax=Dactylellina haptotyla (strain CBS 200.50) TaxID=1284197 RepID=S7ZXB4_DACHA|nr:hypothetical protein H072_11246 [Dactylellina haptotyla CBS 200.50]
MASLSSLPQELVDLVGKDLDDDDLLALRMTSKEFSDKFEDLHLNSIYQSRRVFYIPKSLENLLKISRNPSVNWRVRSIIISDQIPNADVVNDYYKEIGGTDESYTDNIEELRYLFEPGAEVGFLTLAFMNLQSIQAIKFELSRSITLTRKEYNLLFPPLGLVPGTRIGSRLPQLSRFMVITTAAEDMWYGPLTAATITPLPLLETIDFPGHAGAVSLSKLNTPRQRRATLRSIFPRLKSLRMGLYLYGNGMGAYEEEKLVESAGFSSWLGAIGASLETLDLHLFDSEGAGYFQFEGCALPCLKNLTLSDFNINVDDFLVFLGSCHMVIEEMLLEDILWTDPKIPAFRFLKYLKQKCSALKYFQISLNAEQVYMDGLPDYVLPSRIKVIGNIAHTESKLQFSEGESSNTIYSAKSLAELLDANDDADDFWESMTTGLWMAEWPRKVVFEDEVDEDIGGHIVDEYSSSEETDSEYGYPHATPTLSMFDVLYGGVSWEDRVLEQLEETEARSNEFLENLRRLREERQRGLEDGGDDEEDDEEDGEENDEVEDDDDDDGANEEDHEGDEEVFLL